MPDFIAGEVLLVDKPLEWTSFDVVNKLRFQLRSVTGVKKIKVGHAGTLDPLASGLLIVCTGKKTKTIDQIQAEHKEYTGIISLGATTATYDLEATPENFKSIEHITLLDIEKAIEHLKGEIDQVPPIYSAKKIDGKRAYELVRKGKNPEMKVKKVTVLSFEIEKVEEADVFFRISCSKGTYIRSLAHDLGQLLGVGAYLKSLRRTRIGEYSIDNAKEIDEQLTYISTHVTV